ncbi:MAG: hypothetical protein LBB58_05075 [Cellulomonadaceae bacterium]|jgi:hypothetical protein|nr:hypothetical protein [Cellulomonadaceae bacterium]
MKSQVHFPEFDQVRAYDNAPKNAIDNEAFQIQSDATMFQIMQTNPRNIVPKMHRYSIMRRSVIAIGAVLAVSLGGMTAAAANGLSNPVGDWMASLFRFNSIASADMLMVGDITCTPFYAVVPRFTSVYNPETFTGTPSELLRALNLRDNDIEIATEILAGIDMEALPGDGPTVSIEPGDFASRGEWGIPLMGANQQGTFQVSFGDIESLPAHVFVAFSGDDEHTAAMMARFNTGLAQAGIDLNALTLIQTVVCE